MRRPLDEVVASQKVMLERQGKTSVNASILASVYAQQLRAVEDWVARQACFRSIPVEYHDLLTRPSDVAREINTFLGASLDSNAMAAEVDPALCHHSVVVRQ